MSTEQGSTGSGDEPDRSIIGFVPELGADSESAGAATEHDDHPSSAPSTADALEADAISSDAGEPVDDAVYFEEQVEPEYGILGFTLRELVIVGAWALAFIVSFFPVHDGAESVWTSGIDWILTIGVPTAAVFLVVLRRFSPEGIRRVGSLGIDQFASVAAAVAGVSWAQLLWHQVSGSIETGALLVGWVPVVAQIATLALVAATVVAPLIPRLRDDFEGRMETLAHRNADPVRPVIRRPRSVPTDHAHETEAAQPTADLATPSAGEGTARTTVAEADETPGEESVDDATRVIELNPAVVAPHAEAAAAASAAEVTADEPEPRQEGVQYTDPIGALHEIFESNGTVVAGDEDTAIDNDTAEASRTVGEAEALLRRNRNEHPRPVAPQTQPFWILAGTERDVLDERGQPIYRIGPDAWTLVIEDRDGAYVVRHDDGRIGYLHDLTDITKG